MTDSVHDESLVARFSQAWDASDSPPDVFAFLEEHADATPRDCADVALLDQGRRTEQQCPLPVEEYLQRLPQVRADESLTLELIVEEFSARQGGSEPPDIESYIERFPDLHVPLVRILSSPSRRSGNSEVHPTLTLPHDSAGLSSTDKGISAETVAEAKPPAERIGRYRIERVLGEGGCGRVYLAVDEELHRHVAVKVPQRFRTDHAGTATEFLNEARILASLDHVAIVPVYDVGQSEDGSCYVVSKFIEGTDLAEKMEQGPPKRRESAELIAQIADALHYAHQRGLVHRDVKPANILIDNQGRPFLTDFGLALKEEDYGSGPSFSGTVNYMSPEQARGEGHLVDGRSDIFSLGVVLYRLLVGTRPFRGETNREVIDRIINIEPRPPRQLNDSVPKELERICLKALAKRVSDRYTTSKDLASDLRAFLQQNQGLGDSTAGQPRLDYSDGSVTGVSTRQSMMQASTPGIAIVPKGLRSFDDDDADFFLELLPGPHDRDGLPDSLRFWKRRIEETDADSTFRVGLLYGSSGCGKSSLVKAGLLPRLADSITPIFVEATPDDTETRLLRGLRKHCPDLPVGLSLVEAISLLRREHRVRPRRKVLIVLDQFEQWLHTHRRDTHSGLVEALRQCDAENVQCLLLVRDDFWMSVSRFLRELEVPLQEGRNCVAVDRFDERHARRVLRLYGQAFGALPAGRDELTRDQRSFLKQSVDGLADEGRVIPVRLALFAEMIKDKPWTPATLKAVGGAKGLGVAFLEETFSSPTAPPQHRIHQRAARATLKALLPEHGAGIKGQSRSYQDLLEASGYARRPRELDDLLHILTQELRIVTPFDPEGLDDESAAIPAGDSFYQLAHDFLVPALQQWLVRKQQETRRGRAELRLTERSAMWNAKPEPQQLPTLWEWINIRLRTVRREWTEPQRKMMQGADRRHLTRGAVGVLTFFLLAALGLAARHELREKQKVSQADALVQRLLDAETTEVPNIVPEFDSLSKASTPKLRDVFDQGTDDSKDKLHASLALLREDPRQVGFLLQRLRTASPQETLAIREVVRLHRDEASQALWEVATDTNQVPSERFRAACALADYDPTGRQWPDIAPMVTSHLVAETPRVAAHWSAALDGARDSLLPPLAEIFRDGNRAETERAIAAETLADYAADDPSLLTSLLLDATPEQFAALLPKLSDHAEQAVTLLEAELQRVAEASWPDSNHGEWPEADAAIRRQIVASSGLVTPHFAICQALPLGELEAVADALRPAGYRLSNLRPYTTASGSGAAVEVAAIWQRDGLASHFAAAKSAEEIRQGNERQRERGYLPADVAAYAKADGPTQYSALWVHGDTRYVDAKMYVAVPQDKHEDYWGPLNASSFVPRTDVTTFDEAGRSLFSSVRWKFAVYPWYFSRTATSTEFDEIAANDWFVGDIRLVAAPEVKDGYQLGAIWWPGVRFRTEALHGLTPHRHLRQCQELAERDFRPYSLSAITVANGSDTVAASLWRRPVVLDEDRDALARRQANAAVALARLGETAQLWLRLREDPQPYLRSHLTDRLHPLGVDRGLLAARLAVEKDASIRRALLLALSKYSGDEMSANQREELVQAFSDSFYDRDPGVHSAAEFALRRWGAEVVASDERHAGFDGSYKPANHRRTASAESANSRRSETVADPPPRWYVTDEGQTMAIVSAGQQWQMGSPRQEKNRVNHRELRHPKRLARTLAVATTEVTVDQFLRFDPEYDFARDYSPTGDCPINNLDWYGAVRYCRWLSDQEGIPEEEMCYPPLDEIKSGMTLPAGFLQRTGYRLPTEAEWEFLCRANTITPRYYGSSPDLLPKFAYTAQNSDYRAWPVGRLLPNDFGLFDTLGNVFERCHDLDSGGPYYPPPFGADGPDDKPTVSFVDGSRSHPMRGGSFLYQPSNARAAHRDRAPSNYRAPYLGFRVVRTIYVP